jgi:hypothetical protein
MSNYIRFGSQFTANIAQKRAQAIRNATSSVLEGRMSTKDFRSEFGFLPKAIFHKATRYAR